MKNTTTAPLVNRARAALPKLAAALRDDEGATAAEYAVTVLATNYWLGHT